MKKTKKQDTLIQDENYQIQEEEITIVDVPEDWFNEDDPPVSGMTVNYPYKPLPINKRIWLWLRYCFNF